MRSWGWCSSSVSSRGGLARSATRREGGAAVARGGGDGRGGGGGLLAQQLAGLRIDDAHAARVPLHVHFAADPAGPRGVVAPGDLDAAIEVHDADAVLVVGKRLRGRRGTERP